jgi:L-seryl-tRNA(Ser) seleniumtransferase
MSQKWTHLRFARLAVAFDAGRGERSVPLSFRGPRGGPASGGDQASVVNSQDKLPFVLEYPAMKSPNDFLNRLPSVSDLMENPRIKGLVDRVQELEITTGVKQFVERMRREVSRRALDAPIPSIGELADRAARFILGRHATEVPQVVNATGQLWPSGLSGPPLADEALATLTTGSQHYHARGVNTAAILAAELTGGQSARVYGTSAGALLVALSALANGKPIIVARGELGTMDGCIRLTDLAAQAGATLVEVGATDSVSEADYRQALEAGAGMVLRIEALPHALRGQTCRPELSTLVRLAGEFGAKTVHHIGRGPLVPLGESIPLDVVTASQSIAAGISLVIARGDGYTGGPRCGLAIGRRDAVEKLAGSPLSPVVCADPLVETALAATLTLWRTPDRAATSIPTLSLLSTPLLNLQTRAERMSAQIAAEQGILSAAPVEIPAGDDMGATRPLASFGVNVLCTSEHLARIQRQLEDARPQVLGNWSGDRVLLDLRTVPPADDIALVAAFGSPKSDEMNSSGSESPSINAAAHNE